MKDDKLKSNKILLTHIGNRNILYKGQTYALLHKKGEVKDTFRNFTKQLLKDYSTESKHIDINILNTLLNDKKQEIGQVILFSSSHPRGHRNDQDTRYEGELLVKMLQKVYPDIQFTNRIIKVPVTDANKLLKAYRKELKALRKKAGGIQLMVCDAGGTAQQKSSLKIMLEFLYDPEDYEVFYIAQGKDYQSVLLRIEPIEYRRIIDAEQMTSLIEHGHYQGALDLFVHLNRAARHHPLFSLLQFAHFRSERLTLDAQNFADAEHYSKELAAKLPFVLAYGEGIPLGINTHWAIPLFSTKGFFDLCEILALVQFFLALKDYTQVVMHTSRFIENYLRYILIQQFACPFDRSNGAGVQQMIQTAKTLPNVRSHYGNKEIRAVLSTEILVCENLPDIQHQRILNYIRSLNSQLNPLFRRRRSGAPFALNTVRNQIAHQGLGVSESTFSGIPGLVAFILKVSQIFGMPKENAYSQMNESIIELLID